MQEMLTRSLGQEDPLEEEMATHFSILTWEIPQTEEPGGLQSTGSQRVKHNWACTHTHTQIYCQFCAFGSNKHNKHFLLLLRLFICGKCELNLKRKKKSHSVMSDSLWPHGLYSPWNSPGQNTRVGSLSLLQGIFPTQGSNSGLRHCRGILYQLIHKGSPLSLLLLICS